MIVRRDWVLANGVGETLGLGLGVLAGVPLQLWLDERTGPVAAAVVAAVAFALVEGSIVGVLQWRVVRRLTERVPARDWVVATVVGGLVAWLCVSIPFALLSGQTESAGAPVGEPPLAAQLAVMALAGLVAGPLLGFPQALALRSVAARPWAWVWANSRAWAVGLPIIQLVAGGLPEGTPLWATMAAGAATLFAAGCAVGLVHGPTLVRLTGHPR